MLPDRTKYLQRFNAHIAWLAEVLADGRRFILGTQPSAADLSAYHPIWFARQNGGVLDRHGGPLGQERQHRMGGVAKQGHRPASPVL